MVTDAPAAARATALRGGEGRFCLPRLLQRVPRSCPCLGVHPGSEQGLELRLWSADSARYRAAFDDRFAGDDGADFDFVERAV